jgi:hypothetical protein
MLTNAIRIDREAIYPLHVAVNLTGVTRESIRDAIRRADLPATKRGKQWFVRGEDLANWLTDSNKK